VTPVVEQEAPGGAKAFVRRTLSFTSERETLDVEAFADQDLKQPLFVYRSQGPYTIVGPSKTLPGVFEANLQNDKSTVEIFVDAPDLWKAINLGACNLKIGEAVDISQCSGGAPFLVVECVDQELISVEENGTKLRLGASNVNRCIDRPTTISDIVHTKK
jgi:hypothetical protein